MTHKDASQPPSRMATALRRIFRVIATALLGTIVLFVVLLAGCQRRLIYFPRRYNSSELRMLPKETVQLQFHTSQGSQTAFYLPPPRGSANPPAAIWMFFGGNASCALDWLDWLENSPFQETGFLLLDYPGYGLCEGKPSARTILESTESAADELARRLQLERPALEGRLGLLGHSIGAGAALQFAARHPVKNVILISPFTSTPDMARRIVGWPLCLLLRDIYDNRARLDEIAARPGRPSVTIFHGSVDDVIPVRMGGQLAAMHPDWIVYHEIPAADHNWILTMAQQQIFAAAGLRAHPKTP